MPSMSATVSVAANAVSANVVAGRQFEFIAVPSMVTVYATGAAAGLNATINIGGISYLDDSQVPPTNRFPLREEDGLVEAGALGGERILMTARNTTGAAIVFNWLIDVEPAG